jgi:hypothetical protein
MRLKWKAFTIWVAFPYFSYLVVMSGLMLLFEHHIKFAGFFSLRVQTLISAPCVIPAAFGTLALSVLPIRRTWLAIVTGTILGIGGMTFCAWFELSLFGSFETGPGIYLEALILLLPSSLAGAYAGFLRSKEQRSNLPASSTAS